MEVARSGDNVLLRDSKDADSPVLRFTADQWSAFVSGINAGEFSE